MSAAMSAAMSDTMSAGSTRVLILGAGGQLGAELTRRLMADGQAWSVTALGRAELDLADGQAVRAAVQSHSPQILVNAAAYTAVDRAELEPKLAFAANATAPEILAKEMARLHGWLLHYSTDYVFDGSGTKPWRESDATGPLNVYGRSKLAGEQAIAAVGGQHLIFRTSWVYAAAGRNFLHTMLRLGRERERLSIVADQIGAPTSAEALSAATAEVMTRLRDGFAPASGVYHMSCAGETSWFGFAEAIFAAFAGRQPTLTPIPTSEYPTPARRPLNSRLDGSLLAEKLHLQLPHWRDAFAEVVAALGVAPNR